MSLEAARTRARVEAARVAQLLPESGTATLLGYPIAVIRSPSSRLLTRHDAERVGIVCDEAGANRPSSTSSEAQRTREPERGDSGPPMVTGRIRTRQCPRSKRQDGAL